MASVGVHCLLELYGCPVELLDDPGFIRRTLRAAAEHAGATWIEGIHHHFSPAGVTCVGLLAESHISIHTWPEVGYAAVDVFTCGDTAMPEKACAFVAREMRTQRKTLARIPRAAELTESETLGVDPKAAHMRTLNCEIIHHEPADA
ncbi:MAG TPA: adenosylmethionine decarboxylase [Phycisphaerales bacterium]|nr:adenosylmethionine decarboxylase [Phycisphaerales bacterium]